MQKRVILAFAFACGTALTQTQDQAPRIQLSEPNHFWERLFPQYQPRYVPPVSFENSPRLDSLLRAGQLYLSLQDAIALALENNLDVELQRFGPGIAQADTLRTLGGGVARGISLTVNELPSGVGGPQSPILNLPATGAPFSTSVPTSLNALNSIVETQSTAGITGPLAFSTGPAIPVFDPAVIGGLNWQHQTTPEVNTVVTGSNTFTANTTTGDIGLEKGFSLGTQIAGTFNAAGYNENSLKNAYNPFTTSSIGINLTQPLLRGFGIGVNRRYIRIAKNDEKISGLVFRQQVIGTVSGIIRLYFDLVSLLEDVHVKQETLLLAQRLYEDNREKVEQGTLAPIELVRAQAQVAAARQDLANSQGFELQQELIVKTMLTRRGASDPLIREARIVPTTPIDVPATEEIRPVQDLINDAFANRPELQEAQLQIANADLTLKGSRNALLPQVDLVGVVQNSGLAGQTNPLIAPGLAPTAGSGLVSTPDTPFTGGFGTAFEQLLRRNYPTYGAGIQLTLPIHNRVAEGDYIRDEMQYRQTQVRSQQLDNQVRLEVEAAVIALRQTRAALDSAAEARKLQEQSLQIELEKYANGVSTTFLVQQYESFVAQARSTEVAARGTYAKARVTLERAIGMTLQNHNISIDEVMHGRISTPPTPLPALVAPGTAAPGTAAPGTAARK